MILKSSEKTKPYQSRFYRSKGGREHPWLALSDHNAGRLENDLLYCAGNYNYYYKNLIFHNGANVYIRQNPDYVYDKDKEEGDLPPDPDDN